MDGKKNERFEVTVRVELASAGGNSIVVVNESFPMLEKFSDLSSIVLRVHELADSIRDEQAGLKK